MAQYDGMVLTNDGINLLAKCQLGQKIEFTKVLIGDGRVPDGKVFQDMTELVNTKLALGIQNVDFVEDGRVDVTAIINNNGLETGFFVREIGLFAKPVDGAEILYAYTNAGDYADYLPNAKVNEVTDQIVVQSIITNKENVVININDNFIVATKADLKKHDENVNVHVNLMNAHNADEGAHEPAFTAHNADTGSHTDIRNKIGTDISSHNTSTSAHTDIRNKIQTVQQNASLFMLPVKRNTTYAVGDCASATGLPSWAYLECITAGTTAETEPSFGGGRVADGTCVWIIKDVRCPYSLGEFVFKMNEPKDYEYLLLCDGSTISEDNYPELVAVLGGTQLPNLIDRVVQGAATAGTYKEAGLPNITGTLYTAAKILEATDPTAGLEENAYDCSALYPSYDVARIEGATSGNGSGNFSFNASRSNSIYGNSTTVQPPAFTAKIYICYAG